LLRLHGSDGQTKYHCKKYLFHIVLIFAKAIAPWRLRRLMGISIRLIKVKAKHGSRAKDYFYSMKKARVPGLLAALMAATLLLVAGFQVYWLRDNYNREKRSLEIRMNMLFQETVRQLQLEQLKLSSNKKADTSGKPMRMVMAGDAGTERKMKIKTVDNLEVVTMVNSIRKKFTDSSHNTTANVIIHAGEGGVKTDSLITRFTEKDEHGSKVFSFLYGVDSLQDSLKVVDITKAYRLSLIQQKLTVPFTIERLAQANTQEEPDLTDVTVGFAKPVTYRLTTGNAKAYLIRQLTMPILFSVFLIGIVLLSFWLVYRTILKQQRLAMIKNEFISNITHELKTPIATVGVAIEALQKFNAMDDPQKTKEYLGISANELQRLSLLVDKVLKLSMLEKKEIELKYEPTDIKLVVEEVVNSMRLQLEKANAIASINSSGNTMLEADRLHLLSVVYNLLDNALKYSAANPVIDIDIKEMGNHIQLMVKDNGIGIPAEYKSRVFEKFFRVPAGDTHNAKGYGLGLSYVLHIVQQHKGTIEVHSGDGQGSSFIIKLPKQHAH